MCVCVCVRACVRVCVCIITVHVKSDVGRRDRTVGSVGRRASVDSLVVDVDVHDLDLSAVTARSHPDPVVPRLSIASRPFHPRRRPTDATDK